MQWRHYLNAALATLVIGQLILIVQAECYDPCNTVSYCSDPCSPCKGGKIEPATIEYECYVERWDGPFNCCCTYGDGCCQYLCYKGLCLPCGGWHTYAYNGKRVEGGYCSENYCRLRA